MKRALDLDAERILRLSGSGPRYTSYPTAPVWKDADESVARAAYERASRSTEAPLSVYVHLPFCIRRCLFCGCTVEITNQKDRVTRYLDALEVEVELVADALGERRRVRQLHWGGGTPTHLGVAELERLHDILARRFTFEEGAEKSIEIHPHVTTDEQIDALCGLGFNRFSMGVQDIDPGVQAVIHRDQTVEDTVRCIERCRSHGVDGVNLDLMYGLPEQTLDTFGATLDVIRELRPDRLAIYGYAHVPWLKPTQRVLERTTLPGPVERAHLFALAVDRLSSDYEVIGLDHFALPTDSMYEALVDGTLERNFMGYMVGRANDMIGLGASAIGDAGGAFLQNARETRDYEAALAERRLPTTRGLVRSQDDDLRRAIIQALMCRMSVDLDELGETLGEAELGRRFAPELERVRAFEAEGLCVVDGARIDVTPVGRIFLRHLAMVFDAYLEPAGGEPQKGRFSQTV